MVALVVFGPLVEGNRLLDLAEGVDNPDFTPAQRPPALGVMDRLFALAEVRLNPVPFEHLPTAEM